MNPRWTVLFALAMIQLAGVAMAEEEFCVKAKAELKGQKLTAKVPLYQLKIDAEGPREIERDSEEIRQGAKTIIKDVECGAKRVAVTLLPDGPGESVEIYFMISREGRSEPGAREQLDHMMTHVFEEAAGAGD